MAMYFAAVVSMSDDDAVCVVVALNAVLNWDIAALMALLPSKQLRKENDS